MKQISIITAASKVALIGATALLVACGDSANVSPSLTDTTISGAIVAAPVNGADVSIIDGNGNVVVSPVKTDAAGQYTLKLPLLSLTQDLIVKSTGGTFKDEATSSNGTAGEMYAYASTNSIAAGSSVSATPGSTIIAHLVMNHGKTKAEAEAAFAAAFGYTPDMSVNPADATTAPAADETDAETLAGFQAGAFSQLAMDLGLSQNDQFELFAALAKDLSDDKLDGVAGVAGAVAIGTTGKSLAADIQSRFAMAMVSFSNNPNNLTGLDNNEFGDIPFAKVALTSGHQIEYIQTGMMDPVNGKSSFQIKITDLNNGSDATGLTPTLMPTMHMLGTFMHRTPMAVPTIAEDGNGLYTVTLYYLMPTAMGGYWDLKFTVAGQEAHFYPTVMMAMGDTAQVRLKGVTDKIMSMMTNSMVGRTYYMFKDGLACNMGTCDFSVFIATQESMMSFPAVVDGKILNSGAMNQLTIDIANTTVSISVNGGAWGAPAAITTGTNGVWTATGLSLNDGVENQIRIKLTVNSEVKTTDGESQDVDVNDFQTFKVTPGGM